MPFRFGVRSERAMAGIHGDLEAWLRRLILVTPVDFVVLEGCRTLARQRELVASGASRTMASRHLSGHAVDLGAWLGTIRWELALYCTIAAAGQQVCDETGIPVRWGGAWARLDLTDEAPRDLVTSYIDRQRAAGRRPFIDSGHFELPATRYP
jgi:peptidoglycan L-alanyl-D-glutamate endopeptidase CwlK